MNNEIKIPSDTFENSLHSMGTEGDISPHDIETVSLRPEAEKLDSTSRENGFSYSPEQPSNAEFEKQITLNAKNYEPICKRLVSVADAAGVRFVTRAAEREDWGDEDIDALAEQAAMQDETKALIVTSASRICARRVKNPEQMDWAGLIGGITEWGASLIACVREIKKG